MSTGVFPSQYVGMRATSDVQLGSLLRRVRDKVCEKVHSPWSTLQRAAGHVFDEARGLRSPEEVGRALQHFHVLLSAGECGLLYSSFPAPDGSARFDWRAFVAFIFPTAAGEMVAPRYGLGMTRAGGAAAFSSSGTQTASLAHAALLDAAQQEEEEQRQRWIHTHAHPPSAAEVDAHTAAYFGGTMPTQTRSWALKSTHPSDHMQQQQAQQHAQVDASYDVEPAQPVYPSTSASPPPYIVARNARAEMAARAALERAFVATRLEHVQRNRRGLFPGTMSLPPTAAQQQQKQMQQRSAPLRHSFQGQPHAASRSSSSMRSRAPPPPPPRLVPAPVALEPYRAPTAQQRREHTYMLPVPHRVSAALQPPQQQQQPQGAGRPARKQDPHASDAYVQPGIQFGNAFKF